MRNINNITVPGNTKKVLLHCCCAPCSSAIVDWMVNNGVVPTLFYYNPNIFPVEEYEKRKRECTRYAQSLGLEIVDADWDHEHWKGTIAGLEEEPERGKRCLECFKMRLLKTAQYAQENGFGVITTTLASSRWKDLEQINEAGKFAVAQTQGVNYWDQNWRKHGLSERRWELIKEYGFYNQQYCGCEFSDKRIDPH